MPWSTSRPPASSRGYGKDHKAERARRIDLLKRSGVGVCAIGREPIYAEQVDLPRAHPRKVVLDHCTCRTGCPACAWTGYTGLACWKHNAVKGAQDGRARQAPRRELYGPRPA